MAWEVLGWTTAWFAEIDPFCRAVLQYRYPQVPNLGDFTKIGAEHGAIDLLVGGTPCQSFSVAGRRTGLDDPRGVLALEYLALAGRLRPRWLVFENVPGLLSSWSGADETGALHQGQDEWEDTETSDLSLFLAALSELGYGWAYRSLDAQYFGLAQRRERVILVGYLGDWRPLAAVLFKRASLSGNPAPSRKTGQGIARCLESSPGGSGYRGDYETETLVPFGLSSLRAEGGDCGGGSEMLIAFDARNSGADSEVTSTLQSKNSLNAQPLIAISNGQGDPNVSDDLAFALDTEGSQVVALSASRVDVIAFDTTQITSKTNRSQPKEGDPCHALASSAQAPALVRTGMTIRRLTPREAERLQGFPDDWTLVPYRGKPAADGPRYRALGNSMAVPVVRWIGERIRMVQEILEKGA